MKRFAWINNVIGLLLGLLLWTAVPVWASAVCNPNIRATTPTSDFTLDDGNGTATHLKTGLIWMRCALGQSWNSTLKTCTGNPTAYTWGAALRTAQSYSFADYSDWRLPNIKELATIVEERCYDPSINEKVFPEVTGDEYWSSSTNAASAAHAWAVHFFYGGSDYTPSKVHDYTVRLVRGGQGFGDYGGGKATAMLTVNMTGFGFITSTPAVPSNCSGFFCGVYPKGTSVTLKATADSGFIIVGWGGTGNGAVTDSTCTITMDYDRSLNLSFDILTPEKEPPPQPRFAIVEGCTYPTHRKAIVIAHGWQANVDDWVAEMAHSLCAKLNPNNKSVLPAFANSSSPICTGTEWDVWVVDWRDRADERNSINAYNNAVTVGEALSDVLDSCAYQHIHLIGHSAGSNLIQTATDRLKEKASPPKIHETFLDAYDPTAFSMTGVVSRHGSVYGKNADWVDNYVDTRKLFHPFDDKTDLYLEEAYNIDVTPDNDSCGATDWDTICRHSRPYRFYGVTIDSGYRESHDYNRSDPIGSTASMGYPLSLEAGNTLDFLVTQKGRECHIVGSNCVGVQPPVSGTPQWRPVVGYPGAVVDQYGNIRCFGVSAAMPCSQIDLYTRRVTSAVLALALPQNGQAADAPTQEPAWLSIQVQTTEPTNTLRFSYRFAEGGEGLLRVFVNQNTVREMDQRHVPLISAEPESIYIGDLPAGTYKIAFRLDGYGTNPSGVELRGVELGQEELVSTLPGDVNGDGKVDAVDLVAVINHFLGLQNWWPRADCTGDGKVDALDMVFVINRVLGK